MEHLMEEALQARGQHGQKHGDLSEEDVWKGWFLILSFQLQHIPHSAEQLIFLSNTLVKEGEIETKEAWRIKVTCDKLLKYFLDIHQRFNLRPFLILKFTQLTIAYIVLSY